MKQDLQASQALPSSDEHSNVLNLTTTQIEQQLTDQARLDTGFSIVDIVTTDIARHENMSAYGRSEAMPLSPSRGLSSGITPISRAAYSDLQKKDKTARLYSQLALNNLTFSDTHGYRIRVAYRLIRYLARVAGDIPGFSMLSNSILDSDWSMPRWFVHNQGYSIGVKGVRSVMAEWQNSKDTYTYFDGKSYKTVKGYTYLPPHIPDKFYIQAGCRSEEEIWKARINRIVPKGYDPAEDMALYYYCTMMEILAERLDTVAGTIAEPEAGIWGTAGLLTASSARIAWPTRDELIMYEDVLCCDVYEQVIAKNDPMACEKEVMEKYGIERMEATDITKTATLYGVRIYKMENAELGTVQDNRLGHLTDMTMGSDYRCALAAIKERNALAGLKRDNETGELQELRNIGSKAGELAEMDDF